MTKIAQFSTVALFVFMMTIFPAYSALIFPWK